MFAFNNNEMQGDPNSTPKSLKTNKYIDQIRHSGVNNIIGA